MNITKIHHAAIICSDYNISKDFYANKLGFPIVSEHYRAERDSYKLDLMVGDSQIELFSLPGSPERPNYPEALGLRHLAFQVEDITLAVKELEEKGLPCEEIRIDELTGKKFTFFKDPDDLPLELYEKS